MTDWIRHQNPSSSPELLGVLQLAWLGDAVWELHQRLRRCKKPGKSKDLHVAVVSEVKAEAQSNALLVLEKFLLEDEMNFVRKGRNKAGKSPRNINPSIYGRATGFETMIGWLFLKNPSRLASLFDLLEERESDKSLKTGL